MKFLAEYIMRGPLQAILVTAASAAFSLVLPPFSYLSGGALGLVTLRLGPAAGLRVGFWAMLAVSLLGLVTLGTALPGPLFVLVLWLPVWFLALGLRRTASLGHSLALGGLLSAVLVFAFHAFLASPALWWQELFQSALGGAGDATTLSEPMVQASQVMTGILAGALTLSVVGNLFLARWWQALLYNEGGFRLEFHNLRLGQRLGLTTLLLAAVAGLAEGQLAALALDLLMVTAVLHLLQGLALIHGLVSATKSHRGWLIAMYLLLFVAMPQTAMTLAIAGFADAWFDFRAFFRKKAEG